MSSKADGTSARAVRWPWVVLAFFFGIAVVGMVLVAANGESLAAQVPYVIAFTMFGVVGALVVSRDRRNLIGLLLLWGSLITASSFLGGELTTWLVLRGQRGSLAVVMAFLSAAGWLFGILPVIFLLPLLFPDGRLPSRRWRPLLWLIVGVETFLVLFVVFGSSRLTGSNDHIGVANPLYLKPIGRLPKPDPVIGVLYIVIFALGVYSVFLRFRRSAGTQRQQIKWVAFGLLAAFAGIVASSFATGGGVLSAVVGGAGYLAFPLAIGIAVLRFHLYDLDIVVRKAVVYGALALFATLVYLGLVVGLGAALGRDSSFLTMVAAVVVAITFQPVRARMTRFANRIVYGGRATPYEVLSEFSERVGDAYSDEDVLPRMVRVLGEGIGAERVDVWLRVERELRDVAAWPPGAPGLPAIGISDGSVPPIEAADRVYPVELQGELLGALAVRKPPSDPISPADERLLADLARQAGLVLRNVQLTEQLKARLADLKAAQKRLVSAHDEERRRLERNIHDGAQQQLVALAVKARLASTVSERDPAKTVRMLAEIQTDAEETLQELRDLARGIYPPVLADRGLAEALTSQGRKAPIEVDVVAEGVGRYPQEIEAAVYFSVLEGLQNAVKHADATSVAVKLGAEDGDLRFEVVDDGKGFDPATTRQGSGLQGIADRLAALEGVLEVRSTPGGGTTISGRIPVVAVAATKSP